MINNHASLNEIVNIYDSTKDLEMREDGILLENYISIASVLMRRVARHGKTECYPYCPYNLIKRFEEYFIAQGFKCSKLKNGCINRIEISWKDITVAHEKISDSKSEKVVYSLYAILDTFPGFDFDTTVFIRDFTESPYDNGLTPFEIKKIIAERLEGTTASNFWKGDFIIKEEKVTD